MSDSSIEPVQTGGRRPVWGLIRVGVGVAAVFTIASKVDLRDSLPALKASHLGGIGLATILLILAQGASALRWRILIGRDSPPLAFLWRLYAIGSFFSLFLPTSIGGDAVRATAAIRAIPDKRRVVASVFIDRVLGLLALMLFFALGIIAVPRSIATQLKFGPSVSTAGTAVGVAAALAVAGLLFVLARRSARVNEAVAKGASTLRSLADGPQQILLAFATGVLVQGLYLAAWVVLAAQLGSRLPFSGLLVGVPAVSLAAMIPVTVGGLGLREGAWGVIFALFALPAASGVLLGLAYFVCVMIVGALGGGAFIFLGTELRTSSEPNRDVIRG